MSSVKVTVAARNTCSTVGEGPHWDPVSQTLLYVDITEGGIHRYNPKTGCDDKFNLDGTVGFVIPNNSDQYVVGLGTKLALVNWGGSAIKVLHEVESSSPVRFNDAKCDSSGRLWGGTMTSEPNPELVKDHVGALYSLDKEHKLQKQVDQIDISNGLAWTADNSIMYYIDSIPRKVYAFDYDITSGTIANQRVAVDFGSEETFKERGLPDGMCIDQNDNIWVACFFAGKVIQFDPRTGQELTSFSIPARRTTSCCFGGENLDEMYVTCCRHDDPEELKAYPLTGSVFKVTGLGVKGTQATNFAG